MESKPSRLMPAEEVAELYQRLGSHDIHIWLDGGWAVDALLEEQTRAHGDVDIVVQRSDLDRLEEVLQSQGYSRQAGEHHRPWNFVLADQKGHEIDVHVIELDENGDGLYGPKENGEKYPASSLSGEGLVSGVHVRCMSASDLVAFHSGYELDETDYHDVSALCEKFGLPLPDEYNRFKPGA